MNKQELLKWAKENEEKFSKESQFYKKQQNIELARIKGTNEFAYQVIASALEAIINNEKIEASMQQSDGSGEVDRNSIKRCQNCKFYNTKRCSCNNANWYNCIVRDSEGCVIKYKYHQFK